MTAAKPAPEDLRSQRLDRFAVMSTRALLEWAASARRRSRRLRYQAELQRDRAARLRVEVRRGPAVGASPRQARLHVAEVQVVHLREAQIGNRRIGMAVGILMASHHLTEERAFAALRTASSRRNMRLRNIAEEVIYTGTLKVDPDRSHASRGQRRSSRTPRSAASGRGGS